MDTKDVSLLEPPIEKAKSVEQASTAFGVGKQYIADIKRIEKEAPEVLKKIEQGKISIPGSCQLACKIYQLCRYIVKETAHKKHAGK